MLRVVLDANRGVGMTVDLILYYVHARDSPM